MDLINTISTAVVVVVIILIFAIVIVQDRRAARRLKKSTTPTLAFNIEQMEADISATPLPKLIANSYAEGERQFRAEQAKIKWTPWFEGDEFEKELDRQARLEQEQLDRQERIALIRKINEEVLDRELQGFRIDQ